MRRGEFVAEIYLWGTCVGFVSWDEARDLAFFQYEQNFLKYAPIEISPITLPKKKIIYSFPELNHGTFYGLPGLLSDSLPDKFGHALIDIWLANKGRGLESFNPVERLCYVGNRGMGALEFRPATYKGRTSNTPIDVEDMIKLASQILANRENFKQNLKQNDEKKLKESLTNLLVVGTSAGGARAKCIIAHNEKTGEIRSGQVKTTEDFSYWLLKLDGVESNRDKELNDPKGYGRIEYAYYLMACDCKISMMESKLLRENDRAHFMTKRFDRKNGGDKIHMQSLCALAHYDFNMAGFYSYEQALKIIGLIVKQNTREALEQQFRRAVFNILGRNQDDHTKNIAFLMDKKGNWSLAPAFDMVYSYNPSGMWTGRHQMSINGKRDNFVLEDLLALASSASLKRFKALKIIREVENVFNSWPLYAKRLGIIDEYINFIQKNLRRLT